MSHRVTNRTKIRNRDLAVQAMQTAGFAYSEISDGVFHITGGKMNGATLDTSTGIISSDSGYHGRADLNALNQPYAELLARKEAMVRGIQVESKQVLADGRIRLMCSGTP